MRYCYSTDQERYEGDYATREEAREAAFTYEDEYGDHAKGETFTVWTAEAHPITAFFPSGADLAEHAIERMNEAAREIYEDAEYPDASKEQEAELAASLDAAARAWVEKHFPRSGIWECERVQAHECVATGDDETAVTP